ncbi:MAG: DsrE family protein [Uliginosibacterium sp.]|nr:DsrE family protein [Uliginosibacterium sp.]
MNDTDPDFRHAVLVFNTDGMGHGEAALSQKLAANYLRAVLEGEFRPAAVLFYAAGVKLTTQDSPCRETLNLLAAQGCRIIICRTCLDFYGLMDAVPENEIGNMLLILEAQAAARKVITL